MTGRVPQVLPGEFRTSLLFLEINPVRNGRKVILQPVQPRDELLGFLFDIFAFLGDR